VPVKAGLNRWPDSFRGGAWDIVGALNDNLANFGYAVVGIFIASWLVSSLIYRAKRYDELYAG